MSRPERVMGARSAWCGSRRNGSRLRALRAPAMLRAVRWSTPPFVLLAVLALAGVAFARPGPSARHGHVPSRPRRVEATSPSCSIGRASRGHLRDGRQLAESSVLHFKGGSSPDQRWGTDELCTMLRDAARHVATVLPGASLTVGDLSRRRGGWFRPHLSHRTGRDVDIGFYALDAHGHSVMLDHFVRYDAHGVSFGGDHYRFDAARNWELIASLLDDPVAPVQYIFVSHRVRQWILEAGEQRHASRAMLERAATVLYQPHRGGAHRTHFHMRIYCDPSDRPECVDVAPFWGFYPYAHFQPNVPLSPVPTWARADVGEQPIRR